MPTKANYCMLKVRPYHIWYDLHEKRALVIITDWFKMAPYSYSIEAPVICFSVLVTTVMCFISVVGLALIAYDS